MNSLKNLDKFRIVHQYDIYRGDFYFRFDTWWNEIGYQIGFDLIFYGETLNTEDLIKAVSNQLCLIGKKKIGRRNMRLEKCSNMSKYGNMYEYQSMQIPKNQIIRLDDSDNEIRIIPLYELIEEYWCQHYSELTKS